MGHALSRWWRHVWLDEADLRRVLPPAALKRLAQGVEASEKHHTGEICIHAEAALPVSDLWRGTSARERAIAVFSQLRVWDTEHNNGVLIYLLLADRAIEIVADRGLIQRVPPSQWEAVVARLSSAWHAGRFEAGLAQALEEVSGLLTQYFPVAAGQTNPNELSDTPGLG